MVPQIWVDELCPRCGREIPVLSLPTDHLKWWGGSHGSPGASWSGATPDGCWHLLVIEGGAR